MIEQIRRNKPVPQHYDVVIVGAGHSGGQAAIALRQSGYSGTIAIVGEEAEPPYERPPLSKDYLAGAKVFERILIRPTGFWAERDIAMITRQRVTAVDPDRKLVRTESGDEFQYGKLIWAAGGHARRLTCPGHYLAGVHSVRSRADVDHIKVEMDNVERVAVIGGGYIGLEAAAVLTKLGKHVTVLEAQDRVLARVAGSLLSGFFEREHRAHGVDVRLKAFVECIEEKSARANGVRLAGGEIIPCDMVIVGVGIIPSVAPLLAAGAAGTNGVAVDGLCRTSLQDVFAIGDCASHFNRFADGAPIRLESVQNANDMALVAAKVIAGAPQTYDAIPWFWSNQYDLRLQTVGLSTGYDQAILRGAPERRSFSVIYLRQGRVIALDCVNATKDYVQGRQLVANGSTIDPKLLSSAPNLKGLGLLNEDNATTEWP